jgi:hypothetical protein
MTDSDNLRQLRRNGIPEPAMPGLARLAADDLSALVRSADTALRAIAQWFVQRGDPFAPLDPDQVLAQLRQRQFNALLRPFHRRSGRRAGLPPRRPQGPA